MGDAQTDDDTLGKKLLEGLYLINYGCSVYVIDAPGSVVLVDAGDAQYWDWMQRRLEHWGVAPRRISHVLLTHPHYDHSQVARRWRERGAKVVAHSRARPYLLERATENRNEPCEIDIEVSDDCELDLCGLPVRVLTTPGHCPASLSFLIPVAGKSCLFSGDLVMPGGDLGWMGEFCHEDLMASLHKLLDLPVDYQYAGHGCGAFGLGNEWLAAAIRKVARAGAPTMTEPRDSGA